MQAVTTLSVLLPQHIGAFDSRSAMRLNLSWDSPHFWQWYSYMGIVKPDSLWLRYRGHAYYPLIIAGFIVMYGLIPLSYWAYGWTGFFVYMSWYACFYLGYRVGSGHWLN